MPNIGQILREEIIRLARKEVRSSCDPLRKQVRALRKTVKEQQQSIDKLEKSLGKVVTLAADTSAKLYAPEADASRTRITPASIRRHRHRLGLSQTELGELLDVSTNTIVRWEAGSSRPRPQHKTALSRLRDLGVREVARMLEE